MKSSYLLFGIVVSLPLLIAAGCPPTPSPSSGGPSPPTPGCGGISAGVPSQDVTFTVQSTRQLRRDGKFLSSCTPIRPPSLFWGSDPPTGQLRVASYTEDCGTYTDESSVYLVFDLTNVAAAFATLPRRNPPDCRVISAGALFTKQLARTKIGLRPGESPFCVGQVLRATNNGWASIPAEDSRVNQFGTATSALLDPNTPTLPIHVPPRAGEPMPPSSWLVATDSLSIDLLDAMRRWIDQGQSNYGIVVLPQEALGPLKAAQAPGSANAACWWDLAFAVGSVKLDTSPYCAKPFYVSNFVGDDSITAYAAASGSATPIRTITGSNTGLRIPDGVAVDAAGNLYVANFYNYTITVYAAGASGNATPIRTITQALPCCQHPQGIALDDAGNLYVANFDHTGNHSIRIYAAGVSGSATPIRTIAGSNTGLSNITGGIILDAVGNLYVANSDNNTITVYAAGASGNATPIRTIAGSNAGLSRSAGVALDCKENLYVGNSDGSWNHSITVYAAGVSGNVVPIRTIAGGHSSTIEDHWGTF